jgi:hypothetical protein
MNGSPPEIIIDLRHERALADQWNQRREAVGVQLTDAERGEPALGDTRENDAGGVDLEARHDVVHHVEHVLFGGAVVAAAPASPECREPQPEQRRRHCDEPGLPLLRWLLPVPCRNDQRRWSRPPGIRTP